MSRMGGGAEAQRLRSKYEVEYYYLYHLSPYILLELPCTLFIVFPKVASRTSLTQRCQRCQNGNKWHANMTKHFGSFS